MRFKRSGLFKIMGVGAFTIALGLGLQARPAASGGDIYKQRCAMCHGADGKGYPAMKTPNFTNPKVQAPLKDKEIVETIKNGRKGTAMPGFADVLSDEQVQSLLGFIRSFKKK